MVECFNVVNPILQELSQENAEFPVLLFSHADCAGTQYPPEGTFNFWGQDFGHQVPFRDIRSLYVPNHAILEVFSKNGDGYWSVVGPQIVPDVSSTLAFWRPFEEHGCLDPNGDCGKRVRLNLDDTVGRMRIVRPQIWNKVLADYGARGQQLMLNGTAYQIDHDALYADLCEEGQDLVNCSCHNAYQTILTEHNQAQLKSAVNLIDPACDPSRHYVPSGARVASGSDRECREMMSAQIEAGTFPTLDNGGSSVYFCGGLAYENTFQTGSTDPLSRWDDEEETVREARLMGSMAGTSAQNVAYYVIGALFALALLMLAYHYMFQARAKVGHRPGGSRRRRPKRRPR